ncbi:DUF2238 domain-containing protein [Alysiella crassa]|uniref:Inner membrane protein yjdF n=1 Tax=Alysiella crassa TaxID=153491 RepID=A0A376BUF9_9NEIS|nr:DUF2238 domain-containing protein [Alysiella crassa]UOP05976.1 DUF2238 domain-containing protein [Alysiella crassa]SSY80415.1 Inner membrane protein yjdF [Alysiella crassa]
MIKQHGTPLILAILFVILALWAGIAPADRAVWWAEATPLFVVFGALLFTYPKFKFSNTAYVLMSMWLFLHMIGAKYTFADVPFEWGNRILSPLLGEGRNHFDRFAHYIIGFYAFPMAEWLLRKKKCTFGTAMWFALFFIMAVAGAYEVIEWQYAVIEGGDAGIEFLGSQGDIWDAQKDILADTLGAITALIVYVFVRPDKR